MLNESEEFIKIRLLLEVAVYSWLLARADSFPTVSYRRTAGNASSLPAHLSTSSSGLLTNEAEGLQTTNVNRFWKAANRRTFSDGGVTWRSNTQTAPTRDAINGFDRSDEKREMIRDFNVTTVLDTNGQSDKLVELRRSFTGENGQFIEKEDGEVYPNEINNSMLHLRNDSRNYAIFAPDEKNSTSLGTRMYLTPYADPNPKTKATEMYWRRLNSLDSVHGNTTARRQQQQQQNTVEPQTPGRHYATIHSALDGRAVGSTALTTDLPHFTRRQPANTAKVNRNETVASFTSVRKTSKSSVTELISGKTSSAIDGATGAFKLVEVSDEDTSTAITSGMSTADEMTDGYTTEPTPGRSIPELTADRKDTTEISQTEGATVGSLTKATSEKMTEEGSGDTPTTDSALPRPVTKATTGKTEIDDIRGMPRTYRTRGAFDDFKTAAEWPDTGKSSSLSKIGSTDGEPGRSVATTTQTIRDTVTERSTTSDRLITNGITGQSITVEGATGRSVTNGITDLSITVEGATGRSVTNGITDLSITVEGATGRSVTNGITDLSITVEGATGRSVTNGITDLSITVEGATGRSVTNGIPDQSTVVEGATGRSVTNGNKDISITKGVTGLSSTTDDATDKISQGEPTSNTMTNGNTGLSFTIERATSKFTTGGATGSSRIEESTLKSVAREITEISNSVEEATTKLLTEAIIDTSTSAKITNNTRGQSTTDSLSNISFPSQTVYVYLTQTTQAAKYSSDIITDRDMARTAGYQTNTENPLNGSQTDAPSGGRSQSRVLVFVFAISIPIVTASAVLLIVVVYKRNRHRRQMNSGSFWISFNERSSAAKPPVEDEAYHKSRLDLEAIVASDADDSDSRIRQTMETFVATTSPSCKRNK